MNKKTTNKKNMQHDSAYDIKLLFPVLVLVGTGLIMVYSASFNIALSKFGTDYYFLKKQAFFALTGIVAMVACRHFPYRLYRYLAYPFIIIALAMLIAIHIKGLGYSSGGAARWLNLGCFTFQPSEFVKFALIIYLAYSMNKKQETIKKFSVGIIPHSIILIIFALLIFIQPDFGTVVILCVITWTMLFVGGARIWHLLLPLIPLIPFLFMLMINSEYRFKRFISFLDPWRYSSDGGYQIIHSLMAFGSGGIKGAGLGQGYQKLFYLPEPHTDFIFSVIGEELGLWGVLVILGLYAFIIWRGTCIAKNAEDSFGAFIAVGITIALGLQICINIGVGLGLLPAKGLTLPFLSYGGTSLLLSMAYIGVLMNIENSRSKVETK